MTQQDKLIRQIARLVSRMSVDVDYLLGRVHEFGPHTKGKQQYVARRVVGLRADVAKLGLALGSKPQSLSGGAK
jgi:hypothetical protein